MYFKSNKMNCQLIYLSVFTIIITLANAEKILTEKPKFLKGGCQIKDPEFTKCSTHSIQGMFTQLPLGIAGLDTLGSVDPFLLNKIKISQGNNNAVNIKVELSKVKIYGFGSTIVKESRVSSKDFSWKTTLFFPNMDIIGDYALQGRILLIPLNGRGKISLLLSQMNVIAYTKIKLHEKQGFTFFNITNVKIDYQLSGLKANLTNLFNGNKELEDSTNVFFNENWQVVSEALRPVITQTIEDIVYDMLTKIFNYIPANFYITDIPTSKELYGTKD